jgi:hypothetical protein
MITRITITPGKQSDPADRDQARIPADAITSSDQPDWSTQDRPAPAASRPCRTAAMRAVATGD